MSQRWKNRPTPSTWGDFGPDDQHGRMNLITPEVRKRAMQEVREGRTFCLSLPLDLPGGKVLHPTRVAPVFTPIPRGGFTHFHLRLECTDPRWTDVTSDEGMIAYQFSTHWDSFAHKGSMFDADGDGTPEPRFYNGFDTVDAEGRGTQGELGSINLSIAEMAQTCVQGRGVMIDLYRHFGTERVAVGYDKLSQIMKADNIVVEEGDMVLLHTGTGQAIVDGGHKGPDPSVKHSYAVMDGTDQQLLNWITETNLVALAADNVAVERSSTTVAPLKPGEIFDPCMRGAMSPLHEHCLFKLGVHLGELWYLTELANWLHENKRSRVLLTAPPLRLPGAAGAPMTPVATV